MPRKRPVPKFVEGPAGSEDSDFIDDRSLSSSDSDAPPITESDSSEEAHPKRRRLQVSRGKGQPRKKPAPKRPKAKARTKVMTKKQRTMAHDTMKAMARIEEFGRRVTDGSDGNPALDFITSWDIGETYMAAGKMDVRNKCLVAAVTWNLKWDRRRPTIRCEMETLDAFIRRFPHIFDTNLWIMEEQFDSDGGLRQALPNLLKGSEVKTEGNKTTITTTPRLWGEMVRAGQQQVWKGPFMPILENAVHMAGLARGIEVVTVLPRHIKNIYNLPCSGHDSNKILSEEFVKPILTDEELKVVEDAVNAREEENARRGEGYDNREHDVHELWLQGMGVMSGWDGVDHVKARQEAPRDVVKTTGGFTFH